MTKSYDRYTYRLTWSEEDQIAYWPMCRIPKLKLA